MADKNLAGERPLVTRKEAIGSGLKFYFTGRPCERGHVDYRFTSNYICGACREMDKGAAAAYAREWRISNAEHVSEKQRQRRDSDFGRKYQAQRAYREANKAIIYEKKKAYAEANKVKVAAYKQAWYAANRLTISEKEKAWRLANPALASAKNAKRRSTPHGNLNHRMSSGISASIQSGKSGRKWETLVGFSLGQLMAHIERQFVKGMGWHNRHLWHIDHIVPLSSFKFTTPDDPEFKAAWTLTNLRPLWAEKNIIKSDKREFLL